MEFFSICTYSDLSFSFYWLQVMENHFFQKNQNDGQIQNGGQGNFHYFMSSDLILSFHWLQIMEDHFFQKNLIGRHGQVQNGRQENFHYLKSRERVKFFSICLRISVCHFIGLKSWVTTFFKKIKMADKFKMANKGIFII
jgi:hypothetical protein